ncbi:MAG: flagellar export chaperone FlgN [Calditrichia bacterium]
MEVVRKILQLLEKRIALMEELKNQLFAQQKALVESDSGQITTLAESQLTCLEKIQKNEMDWQRLTSQMAAEDKDSTTALREWSRKLPEEEYNRYLAYQSRIKTLGAEIAVIKRNNRMLIQNSLTLLRSTMNQLRGESAGDPVYGPRQKQKAANLLLDKTL